ncbi:MAG: cytochrome c biogenesis protein CcsA [Deltaproteobacteria bacterium]|nr:cytochrome c biogenesis protein CcsA [Deltaproteobacteria bacterium]
MRAPLPAQRPWLQLALVATGLALLGSGTWIGLSRAPAEQHMGEVQRIMYVHVPTAWVAMLLLAVAFVSALLFLLTRRWRFDALHEAAVEVGVVLSCLLCVQGAIWARPTWGVWWDWDPRLTTVAVMLFAFFGVLALRHFVEDPVRRAVRSALATILAFADVPIVYFSVRWWSSLHQVQSTPATMDAAMLLPLRLNGLGMLLLATGLLLLRSRLAARRLALALAPPPQEPAPHLSSPQPSTCAGALRQPPLRPARGRA